jgi:hypothetical protein
MNSLADAEDSVGAAASHAAGRVRRDVGEANDGDRHPPE